MMQRWLDRLQGVSNPIMIKVLYQGIHSRAFICAFWSLLLVALLGYTLCYLSGLYSDGGRRVFEYTSVGQDMFMVYGILLGIMTVFVIPSMAFLSLHNEVHTRTLELVQITGISPGRLVRGSLLAAAAQIALVYALIAPFAVTCFTFGGIDAIHVFFILGLLFLISLSASVAAISMGAVSVYPGFRHLSRLGFFLAAGVGLIGFFPAGIAFYKEVLRNPPGTKDVLLGFGYAGGMALFCALFLLAAAANALTFPHNRSSSRTKAAALAFVAAVLLGILFNGLFIDGWKGTEMTVVIIQVLSWMFLIPCCLGWIVSDFHVTHAQRIKIHGMGRLRRLLYFPFLNGALSTALFLSLCVVLVGFASTLLALLAEPPRGRFIFFKVNVLEWIIYPPLLSFTYVLYLSAMARAATLLFPPALRTAAARRLALIALVCLSAVPVIAKLTVFDTLLDNTAEMTSLPTALFPVTYVIALFKNEIIMGSGLKGLKIVLLHLALPLLIGLVFHVERGAAELRRCRLLVHGRKDAGKIEEGAS